jgi:DNA-binding MarR family transcriptional regulator
MSKTAHGLRLLVPEAPSARRPRPLEPEELAAWRGFLRAHARLTKALDQELMRAHSLSLTSYELLLNLAGSPEGRLRMSELADSVLLSRSGLTRLVDRMERQGLLRRETCARDRRGAYAAITPRGRDLFDTARATHLDGVRERFLSHLSADELRTLAGIWGRMGVR